MNAIPMDAAAIGRDLAQAERFLTLLDEGAEFFTFQTADDNHNRKSQRLARILHGTLADRAAELERLNDAGAGVYVTINETNRKGRAKTNMVRVRAVFADFDGTPLPPPDAWGLEPHAIIESSPGKWHAYWIVDGLPLADFVPIMDAIAARFGSDPNVCTIERVMRLPGFLHRKGEPFRSRIIHESGTQPYAADAIRAAFAQPAAVHAPSSPASPDTAAEYVTETQRADIRDALQSIPADDREVWVKIGHALKGLGDWGRETWVTWSQTSDKWRAGDAAKWNTFHPDRTGYAAIFAEAQRRGWQNPAANGAHDPCTHLANAYRIVKHYGDRLLYVESVGWYAWGPPWRFDELAARRTVQGLGKIIAKEAAALAAWVAKAADSDERKKREKAMERRFKWATDSESAGCIESSLKMAAPSLACHAKDLDTNPLLLGLPDGVLELDTGKHRTHRQDDRITKVAGCNFDPNATAPTWARFVAEVLGNDAGLVEYVQTLAGYALSGQRGQHLLPILWGAGANGKSTFLGALQAALGEYAGGGAPGLLIQRGGEQHPTELADLQGKRLVICSETSESGRLNEERAKLLTGGDAITARRMRQDFYTFQPSHLLVMQTNHRPRVTGTDEGVWRRLRLIPFTITVPPDRQDPNLPAKLRAELPGILTWCWHGWQRYQREGFKEPDAVRAATGEYREASDVVGSFIAECCDTGPGLTVAAGDLYHAYSLWCEQSGERARSKKEFGTRLIERGFEPFKGTGGLRRWRGIGITDAESGVSGASGAGSRLIALREGSAMGYTENRALAPLTPLTAEEYQRAKWGER